MHPIVTAKSQIPHHDVIMLSLQVELGNFDLSKLSVGQVKQRVEKEANVPSHSQKLWWRGYVLDENSLPLTRACVGVNAGERLDPNIDSLVLFMTVDITCKRDVDLPSSPKPTRLRSYSFDVDKVRAEFKKREAKCVLC